MKLLKPTSITRLLAICGTLIVATAAQADVYWKWSFGTESGLFRTDGNFSDTAGIKRFNLLEFYLLESGQGITPGSIAGGQFFIRQNYNGFHWNGIHATHFFRANGTYTNGSSIEIPPNPELIYVFQPNTGLNASNSRLQEARGTFTRYSEGILTLSPIENPILARPDIRIGKNEDPATHKGNNIYNTSGARQKLRFGIEGRKRLEFFFSAESDAEVPEAITVAASASPRHFRTKYFAKEGGTWRNKTAILTSTGYKIHAFATETTQFRVLTRATTRAKRSRQVLKFTAQSSSMPSARDRSKAIVTAKS